MNTKQNKQVFGVFVCVCESEYFWYVGEKFAYKYVVTSWLFADLLPIIHCLLEFSSQYTRFSSDNLWH